MTPPAARDRDRVEAGAERPVDEGVAAAGHVGGEDPIQG